MTCSKAKTFNGCRCPHHSLRKLSSFNQHFLGTQHIWEAIFRVRLDCPRPHTAARTQRPVLLPPRAQAWWIPTLDLPPAGNEVRPQTPQVGPPAASHSPVGARSSPPPTRFRPGPRSAPSPVPPRSPSRPGPAPPLSRLGPHGPAVAHPAPHSASGWVRVLAAATQPRKDPEEGCPAGGLKDPSGARAV